MQEFSCLAPLHGANLLQCFRKRSMPLGGEAGLPSIYDCHRGRKTVNPIRWVLPARRCMRWSSSFDTLICSGASSQPGPQSTSGSAALIDVERGFGVGADHTSGCSTRPRDSFGDQTEGVKIFITLFPAPELELTGPTHTTQ